MRGIKVKVIYYDGFCGFCSRVVSIILFMDSTGVFKMTPLQGERAKILLNEELLNELGIKYLDSFVVEVHGEFFVRFLAIRKLLQQLPGGWKILYYFSLLIPIFLGNKFYDFVAIHRFKIFPPLSSCHLPTPEERSRFIP